MLLQPNSINLRLLPSVVLGRSCWLPDCSAVYLALNSNYDVLYVGKSEKLKNRVRGHVKQPVFRKAGCVRIAWLPVREDNLLDAEYALLCRFRPPLNTVAVRYGNPHSADDYLVPKSRPILQPLQCSRCQEKWVPKTPRPRKCARCSSKQWGVKRQIKGELNERNEYHL